MSKKPVIIFEGIETSGKSTNIRILSNYLKHHKKKFISFREPGGSKFSEKIRNLILNKSSKLNNKTDLLLMLASRSENIDKIIKKNYRKKIILIDRFSDSTYAYQHFGMGLKFKLINEVNNYILGNFKPDITFLSIVNKIDLQKRLRERLNKNRYDKFNFSFYNKVQNGFIKMSKNKYKNYIILDSSKNNQQEIKKIIIKNLNKFI